MLTKLRPKLTYANVISTLCLFLLVAGGSAFAASKLKAHSVGNKQLKSNAVTGNKVADGSLSGADLSPTSTVPNSTQLGGQGAGAFQQRVRWALIDSSGNILAQSGGITNTHTGGCTGCDYLDFGSSQAGKAILVTASASSGFSGERTAALCGAGATPGGLACVPAGTNDTSHVQVSAFSSAGAGQAGPSYVAVIG